MVNTDTLKREIGENGLGTSWKAGTNKAVFRNKLYISAANVTKKKIIYFFKYFKKCLKASERQHLV